MLIIENMKKEKDLVEFQIEKNIPIPQAKGIYPFSKMAVGDSFKFNMEIISKIRSAAYAWVSRFGNGKKLRVKKIDKVSARCWRVK